MWKMLLHLHVNQKPMMMMMMMNTRVITVANLKHAFDEKNEHNKMLNILLIQTNKKVS